MQKVLPKSELNNFIKSLIKKAEVIAPIKGKVTKFSVIKDPSEIYIDKQTLVPLKQFFMPESEVLFEFENDKIKPSKEKPKQKIVFGARKCDLNSLLILDKVMFDPLYIEKRQNTLLIGMFCESPDQYCFCDSMELVDYYDLFFYTQEDKYYISVGSEKGKQLVKSLKDADKEVILQPNITKKLTDKNISQDYKNPAWQKDVDKCLSCAACTQYCPTCNCFDIKDYNDISLEKGSRVRKATSCQLKSFSTVGGGKVFRNSRSSRFKHFVYHKIVYYKDHFNRYMCVGCGRCLRVCPPKIDWVNTINSIRGK